MPREKRKRSTRSIRRGKGVQRGKEGKEKEEARRQRRILQWRIWNCKYTITSSYSHLIFLNRLAETPKCWIIEFQPDSIFSYN